MPVIGLRLFYVLYYCYIFIIPTLPLSTFFMTFLVMVDCHIFLNKFFFFYETRWNRSWHSLECVHRKWKESPGFQGKMHFFVDEAPQSPGKTMLATNCHWYHESLRLYNHYWMEEIIHD